MAFVAFLRAVNVGGHKTFQPSVIAGRLAHLRAVNVGAAGTFVVLRTISEAALRAEILRTLPFKAEVMICPAREIVALARGTAFRTGPSGKDVHRFVSVMGKPPRVRPRLPIERPAGVKWGIKIVGVSGRYALSLRRRVGPRSLYPNAVVETCLDVSATTRNWNTIQTIRSVLERP